MNRTALSRRTGRIRLFAAVGLALVAGMVVAFTAYRLLRWITPVDQAKTAAEIDVTRMALTVVAGVGGVVALVIAYRRQRDLEQGHFVERFGAAAAQLGATDVAVRIAGVYAMAGVADESEGLRRQQCIDVLCGYLRLPYTPELGANHQSKLVLRHHRATADGTRSDDQEHHLEYRHNDREVRATIVRVIADHLRRDAEFSWSASDFDFRTAHFEDADLRHATFSGVVRFDEATFTGDARFDEATFTRDAGFVKVMFTGDAKFKDATFTSDARFDEATFTRDAVFLNATFNGAWFEEATFTRDAVFYNATFKAAWFSKATFTGTTAFVAATFTILARFREATFTGDNVWFKRATFTGNAAFDEATFTSHAWFDEARFTGDATFKEATFTGGATFKEATFTGDAEFDEAMFTSHAWFDEARFTGDATFKEATFTGGVWFDEAMFTGDATFKEATFTGGATFQKATFTGAAGFDGARFIRGAAFDEVMFAGTLSSFIDADFGSERIAFVRPRQWGPPRPNFDWGDDGVGKPSNVEPQDWPPVASTP